MLNLNISELSSKINKKYSIKLNRVLACKKFFISMYRAYMVELYDKGFISDPTLFNKKDIFSNISDLNVEGMITVKGEISLSLSQIRYAIYKNKNNEDAVEFLTILESALRFKQYSETVDKLYEAYNIANNNSTRTNLGLCNRNRYNFSKDGIPLNEAVYECCIKEDEEIKVFTINEGIWNLAMQELRIPEEMWTQDGIFDADLTHEEEVECIELLLNGEIKTRGQFSALLESWLYDHKWSKQKFSLNSRGMYSYLLNVKLEEITNLQQELLNQLESQEIPVVFFNEGFMFGIVKRTETYVPVGQFQILQLESGEMLGGVRNALEGYTGEAYSVSYLDQEDICYIGCPIELYVDDKHSEFFIDLEQTEITNYKTWFEINGARVEFDEGSFKPTSSIKLADNLLNMYYNSQMGCSLGKLYGFYSEKEMEQAKKEVFSRIK